MQEHATTWIRPRLQHVRRNTAKCTTQQATTQRRRGVAMQKEGTPLDAATRTCRILGLFGDFWPFLVKLATCLAVAMQKEGTPHDGCGHTHMQEHVTTRKCQTTPGQKGRAINVRTSTIISITYYGIT